MPSQSSSGGGEAAAAITAESSAAEVTPVNSVDDRPVPCPGPMTKAVMEEYGKAVRGQVDRYKDWVEHV